jgi:hypothetical protein
MKFIHPLTAWLVRAAALEPAFTGDPLADAQANLLIFPLVNAQRPWIAPEVLDQFLVEVFRCFSRKLSTQPTRGWFYAWYDEASGTLRCSAVAGETASELPLPLPLELTQVPAQVTAAALRPIPGRKSAQPDASAQAPRQRTVPPPALPVFARPLISQVEAHSLLGNQEPSAELPELIPST